MLFLMPAWLLALVGGSLAFALADVLCDIVISEGDFTSVESAEDSDNEEGTEMTSTPRRSPVPSKASNPGYAQLQSTPAPPPRAEPAWSEPSPVAASYLSDGQSSSSSMSGTQDAAISGLVTATWLLGSVVYKLLLAPGALARATSVEMHWRPDTHVEFWCDAMLWSAACDAPWNAPWSAACDAPRNAPWNAARIAHCHAPRTAPRFAMLGGLCAFLHNFYLHLTPYCLLLTANYLLWCTPGSRCWVGSARSCTTSTCTLLLTTYY